MNPILFIAVLTFGQTQAYFSPNGGCTAAIVKEIDQAKEAIAVEAYTLTSEPIANALIAASRRGVSVAAIIDGRRPTKDYEQPARLEQAGAWVGRTRAYAIMHNKVMLVDHDTVITGSFNFTESAEKRNAENVLIIKDKKLFGQYDNEWTNLSRNAKRTGEAPAPAPARNKAFSLPLSDGTIAQARIIPTEPGKALLLYATKDGTIITWTLLTEEQVEPTPPQPPPPPPPPPPIGKPIVAVVEDPLAATVEQRHALSDPTLRKLLATQTTFVGIIPHTILDPKTGKVPDVLHPFIVRTDFSRMPWLIIDTMQGVQRYSAPLPSTSEVITSTIKKECPNVQQPANRNERLRAGQAPDLRRPAVDSSNDGGSISLSTANPLCVDGLCRPSPRTNGDNSTQSMEKTVRQPRRVLSPGCSCRAARAAQPRTNPILLGARLRAHARSAARLARPTALSPVR